MKPKKQSGNKDVTKPPLEDTNKAHRAGQSISGHPQSKGGSRQGNVGHEYSEESGRTDHEQ